MIPSSNRVESLIAFGLVIEVPPDSVTVNTGLLLPDTVNEVREFVELVLVLLNIRLSVTLVPLNV